MGNTPSKTESKTDHKPEQHPDQGMREISLVEFDEKYSLGGPFFIEGQKPKNGIYGFRLYHLDNTKFWTEFFTFETFHPLKNDFKVVYDGSIVNFVFQTDSFEKGLKHVFEYSFNFSKLFHSEKEFSNPLKSTPFLLPLNRKMFHLHGKHWYYLISVSATRYEFYIVESSDVSQCGFESTTFKSGDTVIQKINVKSSNFPFVMNDEQGNQVIASVDEGFEPIPIWLPSDVQTPAQMSSQDTSR
jgi:hypothetical protein